MQPARPFWVLVVVLALTAAGACSSGGEEGSPTAKYGGSYRAEVLRVGAEFAVGSQTGTPANPPTVTEVTAQFDDKFRFEVVDAVVLPEDQAEVSQLFLDGTLREGGSVLITRFAKGDDDDSVVDDYWVLVTVEDTEIRNELDTDGVTIPSDFAD